MANNHTWERQNIYSRNTAASPLRQEYNPHNSQNTGSRNNRAVSFLNTITTTDGGQEGTNHEQDYDNVDSRLNNSDLLDSWLRIDNNQVSQEMDESEYVLNSTNFLETISESNQLLSTILENDIEELDNRQGHSASCSVRTIHLAIRSMALLTIKKNKGELLTEDERRIEHLFSNIIKDEYIKVLSPNSPAATTASQYGGEAINNSGQECICGRKYHSEDKCIMAGKRGSNSEPYLISLPSLVSQPTKLRGSWFKQCCETGIFATLTSENQIKLFL